MEAHIEEFASRLAVLETKLSAVREAVDIAVVAAARTFEARETLSQERFRRVDDRAAIADKRIDDRTPVLAQVPALVARLEGVREQVINQIAATQNSVALALAAAEKSTLIAQATADTAIKKAEAAADKQYLESRIAGLQEMMATSIATAKETLIAAMAASEKAIQKAEAASDRRHEAANQFRDTLSDQAQRLMPRAETEQRFSAIQDAINKLEQFKATQQGAANHGESSARMTMAIIAILVTAALSVGGTLLTVLTRPPGVSDSERITSALKEELRSNRTAPSRSQP